MADKIKDIIRSDPGYQEIKARPLAYTLLFTTIIAAAAYIQISGFRIWDLW